MKYITFIIFNLLLLVNFAFANTTAVEQNKINQLKQMALYYYWNDGDLKSYEKDFFQGITLKGKYDVMEKSFLEASKIDSNDLSLLYGVASSQILQSKVKEALKVYKTILQKDPNGFYPNIAYALYSKLEKNNDEYNKTINHLKITHPQEFAKFTPLLQYMVNIINSSQNTLPQKVNSNDIIIVLGYALNDRGGMQDPLIDRLAMALEVANKNPKAKIIVSGGVQKQGVTESYLMKNYLVQKGIKASRIYMEDQAKDTVGNALYSVNILKRLKPDNIILITSDNHIKRASVVFKASLLKDNLKNTIIPYAKLNRGIVNKAGSIAYNEELVIYRDALRTYGFWAYPGLQQ